MSSEETEEISAGFPTVSIETYHWGAQFCEGASELVIESHIGIKQNSWKATDGPK